jgi:Holliday junction resolvasome RuvABC endonuclease subunit
MADKTELRHEVSESQSSPRPRASTSKAYYNRETTPLPTTAIQRTCKVTVYPPLHYHPGAPTTLRNVAMYYPKPPPPSFPAGSGRPNGDSMLPMPLFAGSLPSLPPPPPHPPLTEYFHHVANPYPNYGSHRLDPLSKIFYPPSLLKHPQPNNCSRLSPLLQEPSSYDTAHEHRHQQQQQRQPLWQEPVIQHHDLPPDEGMTLLPAASPPMSVGPCLSGTVENSTREGHSLAQLHKSRTNVATESIASWQNMREGTDTECRESAGDNICCLLDCAAGEESSMGTIDSETLSYGCIQPAIPPPQSVVRRRRTKAIRATGSEDWTQEEKEIVRKDERRNATNNRERANRRDKNSKLQAILAKSSDQPEDRTQEENKFIQACEQARNIKNHRSRARLQDRKNKLKAVLAKPSGQRSAVEQVFLEQQTAARQHKNKKDRLRHARNKLPASEPEQGRMNLKVAPRGSLPHEESSTPSSQLLPAPPGLSPNLHLHLQPHNSSRYHDDHVWKDRQELAGVAYNKMQEHNEYNGLFHKDATGYAPSGCAGGDRDMTTLGVALSASLPLVHVQSAVYPSRNAARHGRVRAKNAAKRQWAVEIQAIKPEDRTPEENDFLQAVGQQRTEKNERSRVRLQEKKHKLRNILAKLPDQRSEIEQTFLEQQTAVKQRKNRGDCSRRRRSRNQLVVLEAKQLLQENANRKPAAIARALTELLVHEERRHAGFPGGMPKQEALIADFGQLQKQEALASFDVQQQAPANLFVDEVPAQDHQARADYLGGLMMQKLGAAPADFLGGSADDDTIDKTVR